MVLHEALNGFEKWFTLKRKSQTARGYCQNIRQFCVYQKDCNIEDVQLEDIINWFDLLRRMGVKHNTFIRIGIALRKFFEYYHKQEFKVLNPFLIPVPKIQYTMPRIVDKYGYQKLLKCIPNNNDPRHIRNKSIITLLWDTGARIGELLSLNVEDIDTDNMRAVIETEKTCGFAPVRQVFWNEFANECLIEWLEKRKYLYKKWNRKNSNALYVSCVSKKAGMRLTIGGAGEMLRRYCIRKNIPYINAHSFRHHFGQELAKKQVNNSSISSLMGHSNVQSSYTYTRISGKELENIYRKVNI